MISKPSGAAIAEAARSLLILSALAVTNTLNPEDGVIPVYGPRRRRTYPAFIDYRIENLRTCLRDLGRTFSDDES